MQEAFEGQLRIAQLLHVCQKTAAFYGETEIRGRACFPLEYGLERHKMVESVVHFHRVEYRCVNVEHFRNRQFLRIENFPPVFVMPSGCPDVHPLRRWY